MVVGKEQNDRASNSDERSGDDDFSDFDNLQSNTLKANHSEDTLMAQKEQDMKKVVHFFSIVKALFFRVTVLILIRNKIESLVHQP